MVRRAQPIRLDNTAVQAVLQDAVPLGARGRLGLPREIARRITWISQHKRGDLFALAVLNEPGRIALHSWEVEGPAVLDERNRLVEASDYQRLRLLEDKYRRIQVAKDGRLTLPLSYILHLDLTEGADAIVYVFLVGDVVEIVTPAFRNKQLASAAADFPELP